jgi:hypothetical protein
VIATIERRPCDGQPNRECPNDCDVDCDFNSATLDRVMNYPLRRVQIEEFAEPVEPVEPEHNEPWSWVDDLRGLFWLGVFLFCVAAVAGLVIGMTWTDYRSSLYRILSIF